MRGADGHRRSVGWSVRVHSGSRWLLRSRLATASLRWRGGTGSSRRASTGGDGTCGTRHASCVCCPWSRSRWWHHHRRASRLSWATCESSSAVSTLSSSPRSFVRCGHADAGGRDQGLPGDGAGRPATRSRRTERPGSRDAGARSVRGSSDREQKCSPSPFGGPGAEASRVASFMDPGGVVPLQLEHGYPRPRPRPRPRPPGAVSPTSPLRPPASGRPPSVPRRRPTG